MGKSQKLPQILWIDLRFTNDEPCVDEHLTSSYKIQIIDNSNEIDDAIGIYRPSILCFNYDLPDQVGLAALQQTKLHHPSLPIIVLTKDHSVELAIWAMRARVWDYFIKPVTAETLGSKIDLLLELSTVEPKDPRGIVMPQPLVPGGSRPYRTKVSGTSTLLAKSYVRQRLEKKITLDAVAKLCGMSKSHFSRTFKNDHGVTFQEFLIQERINKAVDLLKDSRLQVTQVALAVGFADLSNFTRTFQRYIGMHSSSYRKALMYERTKKKGTLEQSQKLPKTNPNPVLSVRADGIPQFVNPATSQSLQELKLVRVEDILPWNHQGLVKACLKTNTPLTEERKAAGRTLVWSYRPVEDSDVVFIYGHDVSDYLSDHTSTEDLPKANPNPVLSVGADGIPQFINPATSQLLQELTLKDIEDILPSNHKGLIKACLKTNTPLTEERKAAGRTLVWSYRPVDSDGVVYIYGHDVSKYEKGISGDHVADRKIDQTLESI